jgi:hypothetical protein
MKVRRANVDMDDTPEPKTLEVRTDELAASIERLPAFEAAVTDELSDLEARYAALEAREDRLVKVAHKAADLAEKNQAVQLALLRAVAPMPAPPSLSPLTPVGFGVEFT